MSHKQGPFRMHNPAIPRRAENIDQSTFESFRSPILALRHQGKTYDQIVDHFSKDEAALEVSFRPT